MLSLPRVRFVGPIYNFFFLGKTGHYIIWNRDLFKPFYPQRTFSDPRFHFQMSEGIADRIFLFRCLLQNRRFLSLTSLFSSSFSFFRSKSRLPLRLSPLQNRQRDSQDLGVSFGVERRQILDRNSFHLEEPSAIGGSLRPPWNRREIHRLEALCSWVLRQCLCSRWRCRGKCSNIIALNLILFIVADC